MRRVESEPITENDPGHKQKILIFTRREYEVLNPTAQGIQNPQIAQQLHLSESSVKGAVASTQQKLEAKNIFQVTQKGIELGLVETKKTSPRGKCKSF